MKYVIPAIIFLIALPLTVLGAIFYMKRKQEKAAALTSKPQQGNAPAYNNVPGTVAAVGGSAVQTAQSVSDTLKSLQSILGKSVPDDSQYEPEPTLPDSTPFYKWGTGTPDGSSGGIFDFTMPN